MARKDLLSEAIADAKAVKETAMANAKLALEEAFTPKLQSMISAKLAEEAEEEMEEDETEEAYHSEEAEVEEYKEAEMDSEEEMEEAEMDSEEEEMEEEEEMDSEEEMEMEEEEEMEMDSEEDEDELDLESIIRELEDENEMDSEEEVEMTEEEEMEMDSEEEVEMTEEAEEEEEEIDLDEVIRTLKEMEDGDEEEEAMTEAEEEDEDMAGELEEAYTTIKSLQTTINEVNLLNAKLLYTNKLFRTFDLNENQKVKVLENFDRTSSVREVKLVFSTLAENLNVAKKTKVVVREGYASKATKSSAPKKKIISEGNELAARWKKLAGLI
tara:strand:- start:2879 stop:3859 length:981 start_codon:yes stop_codon:yes gene_type:complete